MSLQNKVSSSVPRGFHQSTQQHCLKNTGKLVLFRASVTIFYNQILKSADCMVKEETE